VRLAAALLIGAWCAGSFFMWATAIQNFAIVDSILAASPSALEKMTATVDPAVRREAMRYQASELNRLFFSGWGWVQIPLALATLGLAWRAAAGSTVRGLAAAALGITLFLSLYVVPETVRLGRAIDFTAQSEAVEQRDAFWTLHHAYTGLDMLKVVLLAAMFVGLLRDSRGD
jgi:hypothetical protein